MRRHALIIGPALLLFAFLMWTVARAIEFHLHFSR